MIFMEEQLQEEFHFLVNILLTDKPSEMIKMNEQKIFQMIPELFQCKNFKQNNIWHIYDVYEHIIHVVDGLSSDISLRMAALFHDIGKPFVYTEDENGIGHFYDHWNKSKEIFETFAHKYHLTEEIRELVANLIYYHDINIDKLSDNQLNELKVIFGEEGINMLFELKQSDLLAQNKQFHYLLSDYEEQKKKLLLKKRNSKE